MLKEREDYYIELIKTSSSICEVCRKANISITTGNYDTIKRIIKDNNIDISHFKRNSGNGNSVKNNDKISIDDVLSNKRYMSAYKLKNILLSLGIKERRCESCKNTEWLGEPIPLQLHHIDGNKYNNSIDNLQILCPNCHSTTDTWCGKHKKIKRFCCVCGKEISSNSKYCSDECRNKAIFNKKNAKISKEDIVSALISEGSVKSAAEKLERNRRNLQRMIKKYEIDTTTYTNNKKQYDPLEIAKVLLLNKNYTETGRIYGISDNAIRKRLRTNGFPTNLEELEKYIKTLE